MSCFLVGKKGEAVMGMMTVPLNDISVSSYLNRQIGCAGTFWEMPLRSHVPGDPVPVP